MTPSTPILDRLEPPPPAKSQKNATIAGLIGGAVLGIALNRYIMDGVNSGRFSLLVIPWFVLAWQFAIAVHEAGHIAGGWLTGFSIRGVVVCCYRYIRTSAGWRFSIEWKRLISGGMAYVLTLRPDVDDWRYGVMIAAGPAASVFWLALLRAIPTADWPGDLQGPALLAAGIIAAVSLLPLWAGGTLSDMARLITLARRGENWQRWKLFLRYQALDAQCVRPREWDPEGLERAAALSGGKPIERLAAAQYAYLAAADREDAPEAAKYLESMLTLSGHVGPVWRACVFFMAADFAAWRENAGLARAWLDQAGSGTGLPKYCRWSAEAEVLLAEGHFAAAREKAQFALHELRRVAHHSAMTEMSVRSLEEILSKTEGRLGATS